MFIGIVSRLHGDRNELAMVYYDAHRIIKVTDVDVDEGCVFWLDEGMDGTNVYDAPSYDAGGLIELVMQARMRPAEFLPSLYVGKKVAPEPNPNSHHFKANAHGKDNQA